MIDPAVLWLHLALAVVLLVGLLVVTALLFGLTALWFRRLTALDAALDYSTRRVIQLADSAETAASKHRRENRV